MAVDDEPVGDGADAGDLARRALSGAQGMVRSATRRRPSAAASRRVREQNLAGRGGYSGARPDHLDPKPVGSVFADLVADRGWDRPMAQARLFTDWAALVGPDVAAHCVPSALVDGELRVTAESTAWAQQLRLLAAQMTARLIADLGPGVIRRITVAGPTAPSWKHGRWTVRGARGPRDTYG